MVETTRELLEYGLVYINGQVDTQGIQNIYNNSIPCIINTNKLGETGIQHWQMQFLLIL